MKIDDEQFGKSGQTIGKKGQARFYTEKKNPGYKFVPRPLIEIKWLLPYWQFLAGCFLTELIMLALVMFSFFRGISRADPEILKSE